MATKGTANCKLCKETPVPDNMASPRLCAFNRDGYFTTENWCCVTALRLRALCGEASRPANEGYRLYIRRDDQSYGALWVPPHPHDVPEGERIGPFRGGGFIAMSWYKGHGQTEVMIRVDPRDGGQLDEAGLPLTMREAEEAIENLRLAGIEDDD
jgi:hypothetical protein